MSNHLNSKMDIFSRKSIYPIKDATNKTTPAFTLIEILLVIAIISILAGIVLVATNPARQLAQARNAQRASDLRAIHSAVQQYYVDNLEWPGTPSLTGELQEICKEGQTEECVNLDDLVPNYIPSVPYDPQALHNSTQYRIAINPNTQKPELTAPNSLEYGLEPVQIGTTTLVAE